MFGFDPRIVIFDTEFTTWEGASERQWSGPGEHREIVQIGAIVVETENFSELDSTTIFVKPVKNPTLSDYFVQLTGITQAIVDEKGEGYAAALKRFDEWSGGLQFYSWGGDRNIMRENAELLGIRFSYLKRCHDIKPIFEIRGIPVQNYMSSTIPSYFGVTPPPSGHDALNDAHSIVLGLKALKSKVDKS